MIEELEEYLEEITLGISSKKMAQEVRMELEDHILTKAELRCLSGMNKREAVLEVLTEMGNKEGLREEFARIHSISFRKGRIIYEEAWQCRRIAGKLSKALEMPYEELSESAELRDEEVLILVRKGRYQGKCSTECMQYIKNLQKQKIQQVICITLVYVLGFRAAHTYGYYKNRNGESYYSQYWHNLDIRNQDSSLVVRLFRGKGIECVEEKYCYRDPFFFGWVKGMEIIRMISYLEKALVQRI